MIQDFVLYEAETGRILYSGRSSLPRQLAEPGQQVLVGTKVDDVAGHYVRDGALRKMPERPSAHHDFNYATDQWEANPARAWQEIRMERDRRLTATDWVVLRAADQGEPVPQAWLDYRQALRDITEQQGFPTEVVWPEAPTG